MKRVIGIVAIIGFDVYSLAQGVEPLHILPPSALIILLILASYVLRRGEVRR